jgi:PAS domain S-box-containing protein
MPKALQSSYSETRAEQTLRLKRLALVAERSSNAVVLADADRRVVWVNAAFIAITGFSATESIGERFGILLARGSADPAAFEEFALAVRQGRGHKREINIRSTGGESRWALVDMQPTHDDGGALTGWVLVATDLTNLRAQQQLLSLAVDGAGLGTWQWEVQGGVVHCNDRMLEVIGYQRHQLGMTYQVWNGLIHPEDLPPWGAAVRAHLRVSTLPLRMSVRLKHASGRWAWMMFVGAVVDRSSDGLARRLAGVAMDVQAQ